MERALIGIAPIRLEARGLHTIAQNLIVDFPDVGGNSASFDTLGVGCQC